MAAAFVPWVIVVVFTITGTLVDLVVTGGAETIDPFADLCTEEDPCEGFVDTVQFVVGIAAAINDVLIQVLTEPLPGLTGVWAWLVGLIGVGSILWGLLVAFGPWSLLIAPLVSAFLEILQAIIPGV